MRKTLLACIVLTIALSVFGWDSDNLYPLAIGNTWDMRQIDNGTGDTTMSTQIVTATTEMLGHHTFITVTDEEDSSWIQNRDDGLYFIADLGEFGGMTALLLAPETFETGDSWEMMEIDTVIEYDGGYIIDFYMLYTITAIGTEDISVPSGNYNDCLKLEQYGEQINVVSMGGSVISADTSIGVESYMWLKEDIGIVKSHNQPDSDSSVVQELVEFSEEVKENRPQIAEKLMLSASPNPFNSAMQIKTDDGAEVEIFDASGRMVDSFISNGLDNWKPSDELESGIFTIKAETENSIRSVKASYIK
ncbi:MAG: T9SS type A sorting domain-containing protein [Candidatus Zixiibacteriota bacterium]